MNTELLKKKILQLAMQGKLVEQDESDGTLYVKCPKEILESYSNEVIVNEKNVFGDVDKIKNGYHLNSSGQNIISFGSLPSHYKLELDIKCFDDIGDFGTHEKPPGYSFMLRILLERES